MLKANTLFTSLLETAYISYILFSEDFTLTLIDTVNLQTKVGNGVKHNVYNKYMMKSRHYPYMGFNPNSSQLNPLKNMSLKGTNKRAITAVRV